MKNFVKCLLCLSMTLTLALTAFGTIYAEEAETPARPDVFVDFTTENGFTKWEMLAKEYDEKDLIKGEYTVHGMKGQVWGKFVQDETDGGFCRFFPKEPLDANGKDKEGNTPIGNGDFRMTIELDVPLTGGNQILAFCYRVTDGALFSTNNIYFRDAVLRPAFETTKSSIGGSGEFNGNAGFWQPAGLSVNGKWNIKVINLKDLKVEESLKGIRIPIAARENEFFDIKWLCVFDQIEGKTLNEMKKIARAFDVEEYKASQHGGDITDPTEIPTETTPNPVSEPTQEVTQTKAPSGKNGCGSLISGGVLIVLAAALPLVCKKKEG